MITITLDGMPYPAQLAPQALQRSTYMQSEDPVDHAGPG
jgi:hypothetical protein